MKKKSGLALSLAAAALFSSSTFAMEHSYGQSHMMDHNVKCWGVNKCKGRGACRTMYNKCRGMNSCRGKAYIYLPEKQCFKHGGKMMRGKGYHHHRGEYKGHHMHGQHERMHEERKDDKHEGNK